MTDRELMQQALDALGWCYDVTEWPANGNTPQDKAIEALRARLAQPERQWRDLTKAEIKVLWSASTNYGQFAELLQAKLKEKNERCA